MAEKFSSRPKSLEELLSGGNLYKIPDYQRPYSWDDEEHVQQLWEDLYEAWKDSEDESYFLGSIILIDEDDERLDILDGQQRLTTLVIFYAVLRDRFSEELSNYQDTIDRRLQREYGDDQRYRLRTGTPLHGEFESSVLEGINDDVDNNYIDAAIKTEGWITSKFETQDELRRFFEYVDNKIELIKISTSDVSYAVRLFQTVNTRGKGLTVSDLTKSYLISEASHKDKRETFVDTWTELVSLFNHNYNKVDDTLGSYRLYLQEKKQDEAIYSELRSEFDEMLSSGETVVEIAEDMKQYCKRYQETQDSATKGTNILSDLRHSLYWKTILSTARKVDFGEISELENELVALYYSYWIAGHTSEKIKIPSVKIIRKIKSGEDIDEVREYIDSKRADDNIAEKVKQSLYSEVSGENWHRPLLLAIEYNWAADKKIEKIDAGRDIHVEHILPKSHEEAMKRHDYWENTFSPTEANELKHSLGNLVPLEREVHENVCLKGFDQKSEWYVGKGRYSDQKATSFDMTKNVVNSYDEWTPEAIRDFREFIVGETADLLRIDEEKLTEGS